jgi:hypothetical protein
VLHFANFDDRSAKLFDGFEHIRASIVLAQNSTTDASRVYSTAYKRWYSDARSCLFDILQSVDTTEHILRGCIPKIGSTLARGVLAQIWGFSPLGLHLSQSGKHEVYFHNAPQYWVRAMDFVPYFWNERDGEKMSTQVKILRVASEPDSQAVTAMLNSSLFYWWYIICSDGRHLNLREILRFPSGLGEMPKALKQRLGELTTQLMADLRRNSRRREAYYKTTGKVVYEEFYPRLSKPIIDEIDDVLGQHYGLSDEELGFIINYDAKYRMGDELFGNESANSR